MIRLYQVRCMPDDYQCVWCAKKDEQLFKLIRTGESIKERWRRCRLTMEQETKNPAADFPPFKFYFLVARERAWSMIRPLIEQSAEVLPVTHPSGEPHCLINAYAIDALKVDECETNRLPDEPDGFFSRIYTYAFDEKAIKDVHLFRCPEMAALELYCSSTFKKLVEEKGLTGLEFIPIYPPAQH